MKNFDKALTDRPSTWPATDQAWLTERVAVLHARAAHPSHEGPVPSTSAIKAVTQAGIVLPDPAVFLTDDGEYTLEWGLTGPVMWVVTVDEAGRCSASGVGTDLSDRYAVDAWIENVNDLVTLVAFIESAEIAYLQAVQRDPEA